MSSDSAQRSIYKPMNTPQEQEIKLLKQLKIPNTRKISKAQQATAKVIGIEKANKYADKLAELDDFHQLVDHNQRAMLKSLNSASKLHTSSKGKSNYSRHTTEYKFFKTSRNSTSGLRTPISSPSIKSINYKKEDRSHQSPYVSQQSSPQSKALKSAPLSFHSVKDMVNAHYNSTDQKHQNVISQKRSSSAKKLRTVFKQIASDKLKLKSLPSMIKHINTESQKIQNLSSSRQSKKKGIFPDSSYNSVLQTISTPKIAGDMNGGQFYLRTQSSQSNQFALGNNQGIADIISQEEYQQHQETNQLKKQNKRIFQQLTQSKLFQFGKVNLQSLTPVAALQNILLQRVSPELLYKRIQSLPDDEPITWQRVNELRALIQQQNFEQLAPRLQIKNEKKRKQSLPHVNRQSGWSQDIFEKRKLFLEQRRYKINIKRAQAYKKRQQRNRQDVEAFIKFRILFPLIRKVIYQLSQDEIEQIREDIELLLWQTRVKLGIDSKKFMSQEGYPQLNNDPDVTENTRKIRRQIALKRRKAAMIRHSIYDPAFFDSEISYQECISSMKQGTNYHHMKKKNRNRDLWYDQNDDSNCQNGNLSTKKTKWNKKNAFG